MQETFSDKAERRREHEEEIHAVCTRRSGS